MFRKRKEEKNNNKQTFHLTYHRSFSGRTITVECKGKEGVLQTIKKLQKNAGTLGPTNMRDVCELFGEEKKPYQFIRDVDKETIIDIQPVFL